MRRGGKNSHITLWDQLFLYRLKIVGRSRASDPYIKEWLLKKPKIKRAVGRGCEVAEDQAFSQEVLMRTGDYVHSFLTHCMNVAAISRPTPPRLFVPVYLYYKYTSL